MKHTTRRTGAAQALSTMLSAMLAFGALALACAGAAHAALPAPTPAQQQAAAAKKAQADAQAARDKESLAASMDAVSARWRTRAAAQGWKTHAPVAIAAAPAAAAGAPGAAGASSTGIVTAAGQPGRSGDAGATAAGGGANPLVKSEKHGTAPPSEDVKAHPTRAVPQGVAPTVQKGSPDASKK